MVNNQYNDESVYRSYIPPLIITALVILIGNGLLYYYHYPEFWGPRTLPYFEDFTGHEMVEYRQIGGRWTVDVENERLVQNNASLVDIMAVIPGLELAPGQSYEFSSYMSVLEGPKGGGIVFNMQDRGRILNSHLIRLGTSNEKDYLLFGHFNESREFTVQGSYAPENLTNEFRLGVRVEGETYSVLLNDVVVAEDIEVVYAGGNVSLTTWNSKVAFDDVSVTAPEMADIVVDGAAEDAEPAAPAEQVDVVVEEAPAEQPADTTVVVEESPAEESVAVVVQQPQAETVIPQSNEGVLVVPAVGELPYFEGFTGDTALNYQILSGEWQLQDQAIVQQNPQVIDVVATIPDLSLATDTAYDFYADMTMFEGAKGGGLVFNMQLPDTIRNSHMLRFGQRGDGSEYLIYGFFDENRAYSVQGLTPPLVYDSETSLGIEVRGDTYNIVQNDQLIVRDIPLIYRGGRVGLTTWNTIVEFDNIEVYSPDGPRGIEETAAVEQPVAIVEASGELPRLEDFSGAEDHNFITAGGNWQLQEETLLQLNSQVFDIMALIPDLVLSNEQPYDFSSDLIILEGPKGGGLIFNAQDTESVRESHMVRLGSNDGNDYLIYGYFDGNRSFNIQGSVQPPEFEDSINLEVSVSGATYNILVNGEIFARDIPLVYLGGRVGLTTWNSSVGFDNLSVVSPIADQVIEPATEVDLFNNPRSINTYFAADLGPETDTANWGVVEGNWAFSEEGITHLDSEQFNTLIMHANPYDAYSFVTNMRLGGGSGGAGVAFNIPSQDSINGAHIVRYIDDVQLTWGYINNEGIYVVQGGADVPAAGDQFHKIEIRMDGASYSIRLDDELLGENLPLFSDQGRVGFTSTLREVTFDDIELASLAQ